MEIYLLTDYLDSSTNLYEETDHTIFHPDSAHKIHYCCIRWNKFFLNVEQFQKMSSLSIVVIIWGIRELLIKIGQQN